MWVATATWHETCPRPTPPTHIWLADALYCKPAGVPLNDSSMRWALTAPAAHHSPTAAEAPLRPRGHSFTVRSPMRRVQTSSALYPGCRVRKRGMDPFCVTPAWRATAVVLKQAYIICAVADCDDRRLRKRARRRRPPCDATSSTEWPRHRSGADAAAAMPTPSFRRRAQPQHPTPGQLDS